VLSFVSQAPFERYDDGVPIRYASMTHSLNYVSKSWSQLCESNTLWNLAIARKRANQWCPGFAAAIDDLEKDEIMKYLPAKKKYINGEMKCKMILPTFAMRTG